MDTLLQEGQTPQSLSPLTLAFVGDGVYELLVREHLVAQGNCPVRKLHSRKVELVRCQAQAKALESLWPVLSEEERDVALRGRNAHHGATALEALFGYLYLAGRGERLRELFAQVIEVLSQNQAL